jgi:hypothetical protein
MSSAPNLSSRLCQDSVVAPQDRSNSALVLKYADHASQQIRAKIDVVHHQFENELPAALGGYIAAQRLTLQEYARLGSLHESSRLRMYLPGGSGKRGVRLEIFDEAKRAVYAEYGELKKVEKAGLCFISISIWVTARLVAVVFPPPLPSIK